MFRKYIAPYLIFVIYSIWSKTWRYKVIANDSLKARLKSREPIVFAHWHGDELSLIPLIGPYRVATMTSTSKDGELMTRVVHMVGGVTSRGSATRGAIGALKGLFRLMRSGRNASMAVDGPKGPLHVVKPGVFEIARIAKAPIFCAGVASSRSIFFEKAWNKARFPKPFSEVVIYWSGPFHIAKEQDPRDPSLAQEFQDHLMDAHAEASKIIANNDIGC